MEYSVVYQCFAATTGNFHHRLAGLVGGQPVPAPELTTAQDEFRHVVLCRPGLGLIPECRSVGVVKGDVFDGDGHDGPIRSGFGIIVLAVGGIDNVEEAFHLGIDTRDDSLVILTAVEGAVLGYRLPLVVGIETAGNAQRTHVEFARRIVALRAILGVDDETAVAVDGIDGCELAFGDVYDFVVAVAVEHETFNGSLQVTGGGSP